MVSAGVVGAICCIVIYIVLLIVQSVYAGRKGSDEEEEDDRIFYYCDGLEDLKGLAEEGRGSDFIVTDIFSFQEQL